MNYFIIVMGATVGTPQPNARSPQVLSTLAPTSQQVDLSCVRPQFPPHGSTLKALATRSDGNIIYFQAS